MPPTEPTNLVASTKCIKVFTFNYGWKVNKMNILDNTVQAKLQCFSQTGRNLCLCLIRVIIPCVTTEQSQKQRSTKKFSNIHNKLCGDSIAYSNKDYKRKHWELILLCFFFCQEKKTRFWINIIHLPPPPNMIWCQNGAAWSINELPKYNKGELTPNWCVLQTTISKSHANLRHFEQTRKFCHCCSSIALPRKVTLPLTKICCHKKHATVLIL